ncbi:nuclear pore complex protein Nup98-Nup96-like isoform X2 [Belonocnema kinseyi]|uniref:nuclear pore complex protein Nup98-Nup96-like isoform X2 n=1 Tax=Belonocnema kinseyi TaxID=2817044 RepID=UPI00143DA223|nr:nuclear pore complex protein Nup98-Nup96-like isoform X2 [Belonocnema kinseyi]
MFGQTGNTSFGAFNTGTQTSPFAQSAFGKPTTSFGTGATPAFGTNTSLFSTKPAGTTSGGLFGSSAGTSAFGQPITTQSSFGGFGGTNTNANLFGTQQTANTNLFGASSAPAFGQVTKPAGFGFGTSTNTNLFGQPQQTSQQTTPFGQTNPSTNAGLFGSTTGFGASNTATGMTGTVLKFNPVTGTDTMMKNGVTQTISTRHHCITCMKEYESKSLEELRLEDYLAGRKGTQNQATGLFGTPAQPSLFGTVTAGTSTVTPSFGSTSGGFGTTNQPGGTGLFNKPIASFGVPTTTTGGFPYNSTASSSLFAPATSTSFGGFGQPGTSLFGAKPAGTIGFGTSTFGGTTTPSFGTNLGFGTTQNTNTSLFNTFKPAGQTTGFSFGAPTSRGTNSCLISSGAFNQQKPAFNASPGFGITTAMPSLGMNMFGGVGMNQAQQNAGSVPVHQQVLALVSAPFGNSPLLKNLLPASGKAKELLKPLNPTNRMTSPQYKVSTNNSPRIKASVATSSNLSKKSLFEGLEEEDPSLVEAFQPRPNAKRLVLRPKHVTVSQSVENINSPLNGSIPDNTRPSSRDSESTNKENQESQSPTDPQSSVSWLKSTMPAIKTKEAAFDGQESPFRGSDIPPEGIGNTMMALRPKIGNHNQSSVSSKSSVDKNSSDSIERDADYSPEELVEAPRSSLPSQSFAKLANVKLQRVGYYTIPAIDKLDEYVCDETCIVPNFTVGREGYGNVYFSDSFDIYGLNLDDIVHFRHKEVIIYPDDDKKPPIGQGLNRRAKVTLDGVWPQDKSRHEAITDPNRLQEMNYEGKLRRVSDKHDTRFLEYRPETGSWIFKVEHFSKYGLSDSEDEDNEASFQYLGSKKLKLSFQSNSTEKKRVECTDVKVISPLKNSTFPPKFQPQCQSDLETFCSELQFRFQPNFQSDLLKDCTFEEQTSPTSMYARMIGIDSHKLQLMKADLFQRNGTEDIMLEAASEYHKNCKLGFDYHSRVMEHIPILRSNLSQSFRFDSIVHQKKLKPKQMEEISQAEPKLFRKILPAPIVEPKTVVLKSRSELIPLKDSIISKLRASCIADLGIPMGRMFRASWGPGLTLITLNTQQQATNFPVRSNLSLLGSYISGRHFQDETSSIVQRLQILGGSSESSDYVITFKESIESHLKIQLDHSIVSQESDCPVIGNPSGKSAVDVLHAHFKQTQHVLDKKSDNYSEDKMIKYYNEVWRLCISLWGYLPELKPDDDQEDHNTLIVRKEALSDWLKNVIEERVRFNIAEIDSEDEIMFELLTANKLDDACSLARNVVGDHCLALLMSQLGGTTAVRVLVKQQLALWQEMNIDADMSIYRLKMFMLAAGEPLICSSRGTVNVCENLDWKRALALHLWYLSLPTASIRDALELYEESFKSDMTDLYGAEPRPQYFREDYEVEFNHKKAIYDLCFHLLKLHSTGNHPMEPILNPLNHTADSFDYRLSWLIQAALIGLGYSHLSEDVEALTHANFAAQLETYDLWHWAIFVVLHLKHSRRRRKAVKDLLARHVELDEDEEYEKRENFLREELGIKFEWINEAKGVKACALKRYGEAAWYFTQAEMWNKAHEVINEYLAADAIINENYHYLNSLLAPLIQEEGSNVISGWMYQGQLLWDYLDITAEIKSLLKTDNFTQICYKLELLRPQLTNLCSKINLLPCPTAKDRLCQAEIAKRTLQLAKSMLMLQSTDSLITGKALIQLVSQLPLPEDYAQQELRPIINRYAMEVAM